MKRWVAFVVVGGTVLALGIGLRSTWNQINVPLWQRQVNPGPLSASHARLESNCTACHTAVKSAEPTKCIGCHANNAALLQRQPTAFHASIGDCSTCHIEHRGISTRPISMDHAALADIGLEVVRRRPDNPSNSRLLAWLRQHETVAEVAPTHPGVTSTEAALNCVTCHSTKDRHQGYFGGDCASCHRTASWTIAEFLHPSPRSVECVQCHQPPPSHLMMHFTMVSRSVAKRPDARVDQCFLCHQSTSWNDIRQVGWYKHH
jgi:hypothetical protein